VTAAATHKAPIQLRIAMLPEDLMKAGLDRLGPKWK
jgi:hypothetical protein